MENAINKYPVAFDKLLIDTLAFKIPKKRIKRDRDNFVPEFRFGVECEEAEVE